MKSLSPALELFRVPHYATGSMGDSCNFCLKGMPLKNGVRVVVIGSNGGGWDHVSVSTSSRCLTWEEMCEVKDLFFEPEETVVQYHPAKSAYRNLHNYCLHLWRPQIESMPVPDPAWVA